MPEEPVTAPEFTPSPTASTQRRTIAAVFGVTSPAFNRRAQPVQRDWWSRIAPGLRRALPLDRPRRQLSGDTARAGEFRAVAAYSLVPSITEPCGNACDGAAVVRINRLTFTGQAARSRG